MITIPFEIVQDEHIFRDAIVLPDDHTLTQTEIDAIKQQRFDAWLTLITTVEEIVQE